MNVVSVRVDPSIGGELVWETPLEGLRIGASGGQYHMTHDISVPTGSGPLMLEMKIEGEHAVGSIEFIYHNFVFSAEYKIQKTRVIVLGNNVRKNNMEESYAMASYRFADWFELGTYSQ